MLKWAVNGNHHRQQSHLKTAASVQNLENIVNIDDENADFIHRKKSRRSLSNIIDLQPINRPIHNYNRTASSVQELECLKTKLLNNNKENNLTSTPLPLGKKPQQQSPFRKLDSLKDLSNITPENFLVTPLQTPLKTIQPKLENISDINCTNLINQTELQYAPTLPTFDAEYSPCSIIPGPILALRGVGIADSYFEKPRYFTNKFTDYEKNNELENDFNNSNNNNNNNYYNKRDIKENINFPIKYYQNEDDSLSSSKMGDLTLNKMIDAILESARKEKKISKPNMSSSTYTRAEDPANDLNEIWDNKKLKYMPNDKKRKFQAIDDDPGGGVKDNFQIKRNLLYNEREICTPEHNKKLNLIRNNKDDSIDIKSFHLRRQRAVRRKKHISLTSSVMNSAQKFFGQKKIIENIDNKNEIKINLSPDSGRNSDSDIDETNENLLKKKLLFSPVK